jgi:sterol desaturase/sphingolipid hydroxylase (fatty acid hydroxylase superfamily)
MGSEGASLQVNTKRARIAVVALAAVPTLGGLIWLWISPASLSRIVEVIWAAVSVHLTGAVSERMLELMVLAALVLVLEVLVVGWRRSSMFRLSLRPRYTAIIDVLSLLSTIFNLSGALALVLTLGLSVGASRLTNWILSQYGWSRIHLPDDGIPQLAIGFGIYWLAMTFFDYWAHRLLHTQWFWYLHRFHHAATELNVLTVTRQHPLELLVLSFVALLSPLVFFDVSDQILLVYFVWGTTFDLFAHSQLPWGYGWFGNWVVASPRVHQVHHSIDDEHRDMHFSKCPLWDHLFATWYKGQKAPEAYGIPDNGYEVHPFRQFVQDALAFYSAVVRGLGESLARSLRIAG